jgi:Na+/H+ antiporter NhaC
MKNYNKINNISGWAVFIIASVTYLMTIEPTASLWDCGEFIASAFKLEVGHPPGNPVFMVMARFFTLFAGGNVSKVSAMVNSMSAMASAFTILFLFWTITHLAKKILLKSEDQLRPGSRWRWGHHGHTPRLSRCRSSGSPALCAAQWCCVF